MFSSNGRNRKKTDKNTYCVKESVQSFNGSCGTAVLAEGSTGDVVVCVVLLALVPVGILAVLAAVLAVWLFRPKSRRAAHVLSAWQLRKEYEVQMLAWSFLTHTDQCSALWGCSALLSGLHASVHDDSKVGEACQLILGCIGSSFLDIITLTATDPRQKFNSEICQLVSVSRHL